MKYFIKLGLVLLIITAIASGILAYVNNLTKGKIEENKITAKKEARFRVLPEAAAFDSLSVPIIEDSAAANAQKNPLLKPDEGGEKTFVYYRGKDKDGKTIGYTFTASQYGYSSTVKTMVGVDSLLNIVNIEVIEQAETPGLGANAAKKDFTDRFAGKTLSEVKLEKDGGKIKSLTGATITSNAVTESVAAGLELIRKEVFK